MSNKYSTEPNRALEALFREAGAMTDTGNTTNPQPRQGGEQQPSVGRVVHFVYGDKHYAAIITDPDWHGGGEQSLTIFPPQSAPFYDVAPYSADPKGGTWHWPEFVPPKG